MSAETAITRTPPDYPGAATAASLLALAGHLGSALATEHPEYLAAYVTPPPAPDPIVDPADWEPQPVTITDGQLYGGTAGDHLSEAEIVAIHAAWDERAWLAVCEGARWPASARPVPAGAPPAPPVCVPRRYLPVSPDDPGEDKTLMPDDGVPVLTDEVIAAEEARLAGQRAADEAAAAVQADAQAALLRAHAKAGDLEELAKPGDGRDAAGDGTEVFTKIIPAVPAAGDAEGQS